VAKTKVGDVEGEIVRRLYGAGRHFHDVYIYRSTEGRSLGISDLLHVAHVAIRLRLHAWIRRL